MKKSKSGGFNLFESSRGCNSLLGEVMQELNYDFGPDELEKLNSRHHNQRLISLEDDDDDEELLQEKSENASLTGSEK